MHKVAVIGSGFSGLSAAAYLSAAGYEVSVFEKNATAGGRARQLKTDNGYVFDMGPSWYWMPDVFDKFFHDFGHRVSDFYRLTLLSPSFDIIFPGNEIMSVPDNYAALTQLFESIEPGSGPRLHKFMEEARFKYEKGMQELVYMPGLSIAEFANADLIKGAMRLQVFSSFSKHVRKFFKDPRLIALMEFPVLFLGAMPEETPALYSLMNYAGLKLGTWYPEGGFGSVINAIEKLASQQGVQFHFNAAVSRILVNDRAVNGVVVNGEQLDFDAVVATADYHHVESKLLPADCRNYDEAYWQKKTFAPSCLIFYVGLRRKLESLQHHTLFFEEELAEHSRDIYVMPKWPARPLFYVCCPSKTDPTVAPPGHENLFFLMPVAPGLEDSVSTRETYFKLMVERFQKHTGEDIRADIDFRQGYCINDFVHDYNSYKGNAYGLANTLMQTAILKPKMKNRRIKNLFYAGQLTVPGPGVPPSLISGKIAADQVIKHFKTRKHEAIV
jgi:phytoene desaturase